MIVTYPVMYPAEVVRIGRRRPEVVLLAAEAHFRIPEPPGFDTAVIVRQSLAENLASSRATRFDSGSPSAVSLEYASDSEDAEILFSPMRLNAARNPLSRDQWLDGAAIEALGRAMVRSESGRGMVHRSPLPFQLQEILPREMRDWDPPVLPETTAFRSVAPAGQDARDRAIAHAGRVAAGLRADASGILWEPTEGPHLAVSGGYVSLRLGDRHHPTNYFEAVFPLQERGRAEAFAAMMPYDSDDHRCPSFQVDVLRPAAHRWSSTPRAAVALMRNAVAAMSGIDPQLHPEQGRTIEVLGEEAVRLEGMVRRARYGGDAEAGRLALSQVADVLARLRDAVAQGWPDAPVDRSVTGTTITADAMPAMIAEIGTMSDRVEWGVNTPLSARYARPDPDRPTPASQSATGRRP